METRVLIPVWDNSFHSCVSGVHLLGSGASTFLPYCLSVTSHLDLLLCSPEPWTGTCTRPCVIQPALSQFIFWRSICITL